MSIVDGREILKEVSWVRILKGAQAEWKFIAFVFYLLPQVLLSWWYILMSLFCEEVSMSLFLILIVDNLMLGTWLFLWSSWLFLFRLISSPCTPLYEMVLLLSFIILFLAIASLMLLPDLWSFKICKHLFSVSSLVLQCYWMVSFESLR